MEYTHTNNHSHRPFAAYPDVEAWFESESMTTACSEVLRCIERSEGVAMIFGPPGVGKTLLLRRLASILEESCAVVNTKTAIRSEKSFLQHILAGLHQTWCGCDENELRLFLADYLQKNSDQKLVLLIDEAQFLPTSVFEDIRTLLDLGTEQTPLVSVALAGTPRLEERLTRLVFTAFNQRVVSRNYLEHFTSRETGRYIDSQLARSQETSRFILTPGAKRQIHEYTDGVPRIINQLCDLMIWGITREEVSPGPVAASLTQGSRMIDENEIRRWWNRLQQSDNHGTTSSEVQDTLKDNNEQPVDVIEFGTLDDDSEEVTTEKIATEISKHVSEHTSEYPVEPPFIANGPVPVPQEENESDILSFGGLSDESEEAPSPALDEIPDDFQSSDRIAPPEEILAHIPDSSEDDTELVDVEEDTSLEYRAESQQEATCRIDTGHRTGSGPVNQDKESSPSLDERYLKELQQLEGEVSLEAQLIRQLREIQVHLKNSHATAYDLSNQEKDVPDTNSGTHSEARSETHSGIPAPISEPLREGIRKYLQEKKEPPKRKKGSQFDAVFRQIYEK